MQPKQIATSTKLVETKQTSTQTATAATKQKIIYISLLHVTEYNLYGNISNLPTNN